MKAAIYCRVSTELQEREGSSLDTQAELCLAKVKALGYESPPGSIFRESYSGLSLNRPKLDQLRELIRDKGIDTLICHSLDRLSRDPVHLVILQEEFERAGVGLVLIAETHDSTDLGKLITYIRGYAAKVEAEKITDRTRLGRKARIKAGKLAYGKANYLFGYDYIPGKGEGQGIRAVNPETAEVITDIFKWYVDDGLPIDHIIYRLRDLGIASPTGRQSWCRTTVWDMLRRPAYCGDVFTPALIDRQTFARAQAKLKRNKELASRNVKRDYLLRGYVFCQLCGGRYQGALKRSQTHEGAKEYRYYRCPASHKMSIPQCPSRSIRAECLEAIVWEQIEQALSNPRVVLAGLEALKSEGDKAGSLLTELASVEGRLAELDGEQGRLLQWALKGFPEETITQENKGINREREELQRRRVEIKESIAATEQARVSIDDIEEAVARLRGNLSGVSIETKRLALEALSIRVTIGDGKATITGNIPMASGRIVSAPSWRSENNIPIQLSVKIRT